MDWEDRYTDQMRKVRSSQIMDLIRTMSDRPLINLTARLPDPAGFPVQALKEAADQILTEDWRAGLQSRSRRGFARFGTGSQRT